MVFVETVLYMRQDTCHELFIYHCLFTHFRFDVEMPLRERVVYLLCSQFDTMAAFCINIEKNLSFFHSD